jgi:hypothetical protein
MLSRALKTHFVAAIRRMLRPIVRQLISYGVSYPAFDQLVKQVFVEVAEDEFALPFKRQTDSRLALVTGLSRKEVAALRRKQPRDRIPDVEDNVVTHVVGRWMAGPPYASAAGVPNRLRYESSDAAAASFTGLVRALGVDIPVRAVLDELVRLGTCELCADGTIELRAQAHIPAAGTEGKLALLGSDPAEVFQTIVHNLAQPERPWLQRKVVYDNIGSEALGELGERARALGEEFLRGANVLMAGYDRDRNPDAPGGKRSRVALGIYYFQEEAEPTPASTEDQPPAPPGRIRRPR